MRKNLLLTLIIALTASVSSNLYSQTFNENDKEGLRNFLRQSSSVAGKTNLECLGLSISDTLSWNSSEEWLQKIQQPAAIVYIDWGWDFAAEGRLNRLEIRTFDDTKSPLSGHLDCSLFDQLEYIDCSNSEINELTVAYNGKLKYLDCSENNLVKLDLMYTNLLTVLNCSNNQLSALDISLNFNLSSVDCSNNQLSTLNAEQNVNLVSLACADNNITDVFLPQSPMLEALDCSNNKMSSLALSKYPDLKLLACGGNSLAGMSIGDNKLLEALYINGNTLSDLSLTTNSQLLLLHASDNQIGTLNVGGNGALEYLYCAGNGISDLSLTGNSNLKVVNCSNNELSDLDLSGSSSVVDLNCSFNKIEDIVMASASETFASLICNDNNLMFSTIPVDYISSTTKQLVYSPQAVIDGGELNYGTDPVDLSSEYTIKGNNTTYNWFLDDAPTTNMEVVSNGVFSASLNRDNVYVCKMENASLPDLMLEYTIKILQYPPTGIEDTESDSGVSIYYDKESGVLHVKSNDDQVTDVGVFNILGQFMQRAKQPYIESGIQTNNYQTGVYVVIATLESGKTITRKISIK